MTWLRARPAGWCLLAALGLHAVVGAGLQWQAQALAATGGAQAVAGHSAKFAARHATAHAGAPRPLQLRWLTMAAAGPADAPPRLPVKPAQAPHPAAPMAMDAPDSTADAARPDASASTDEQTEATPPQVAPTLASADAPDGLPGYARRDLLDRGPQALGVIQIAYPQGVEPGHVHTGRLTLFIDETGTVRKVLVQRAGRSDDPHGAEALPPPFVEAAREAFMQAHFAPGERQGMAVKSRIDIEVSFDGREADPLEAARQAQDSGRPGRTPDRPV